MTIGFWLVVALLLALALVFVLPGLWKPRAATDAANAGGANVAVYRDQLREAERDLAADVISPERVEQLRAEIQHRVLEDTALAAAPPPVARPARRLALALAVVLPLASVLTYLSLGRPDALAPLAAVPAQQHEVEPAQLEAMVTKLAERLKAEPANIEGWVMLGRSYTAMSRYGDAAMAFRKVNQLLPGNADVLADLADVLGMAQGRTLKGEPEQVIQQALAIDPRHVKALALAGSAAFEAKDYAAARKYWERLVAAVPADSEIARSVRGSIEEAAQLEKGGPAPVPPAAATAAAATAPTAPRTAAPATAASATPAAAATMTGEVRLSPELASRVAAGDTLFVFARAAQGPRLPLAIVRQPVGAWPVRFAFDDSMAMDPNFKLSGFAQVIVGARVSKSGNATPQSGDLVGQSEPLANTAQGLRITIDRVQP